MGQLCHTSKQVISSKQPSKEDSKLKELVLSQKIQEKKIFQHFKKGYSEEYSALRTLNNSGSVLLVQNQVTKIIRVARILQQSEFIDKLDLLITLLKLDHTHLSKIYDIYWEHENVYVIEEYYDQGLFITGYVRNNQNLENYVALIMKSLLSAIGYLHSFGIVHGSINFENILVNQDHQIKLIGYGYKLANPTEPLRSSPPNQKTLFLSPEIINKQDKIDYQASDMWACGIFMHKLLTGNDAFLGNDEAKLQRSIIRGVIDYHNDVWKLISSEAINFIKNLLSFKQSDRNTAQQMLKDGWLNLGKKVQRGRKIPIRALKELHRQQKLSPLQQASIQFLVNNVLDQKERDEMIQQFTYMDTNGDGLLSREEMLAAFQKKMPSEEAVQFVDSIFDLIDTDHSGTINYAEYVCAVYNKRQLFTEEKLEAAFRLLDRDHSGWLSNEEIKKLLNTSSLPPQKVKEHIKSMDKDGDGKVSIDEFKDILRLVKKNSQKSSLNQEDKRKLNLRTEDFDLSTLPSVCRSPKSRSKSPGNKDRAKKSPPKYMTGGQKVVSLVRMTSSYKYQSSTNKQS